MDVDEDEDYPPLFAKKSIMKRKWAKKLPKKRKIVEQTVIVEETEINSADSLEFHNFVSANSIFGTITAGVAVVSSSSSRTSSSSSSDHSKSGSGRAHASISSGSALVRSPKRSRSQAPATSMWWFDAYASESREYEESINVMVEWEGGGKRGKDDGMPRAGVDRQRLP